jgi:PspA associated protein B
MAFDALDNLFGKISLPKATIDNLFAISTARITMQSEMNLNPSSAAGLCFKPLESARYDAARTEIEELLQLSSGETGTTYRISTDEFRFTWVVLEDPDFDDLVTGLHMVSETLIERGYGTYLLCAIFRFEGAKPVYWIYNFKQGRYYPFVPLPDKKRDNAMEFRMKSLLERELPVEKEVGMWYPLWGIPL